MRTANVQTQGEGTANLRRRIESSPILPLKEVHFTVHPPFSGWALGAVSGVAVDASGTIYLIQRGDKADPVIAMDQHGNLLRSWGKGDFTLPHSIRIDPEGYVWTVDAGSSVLIKYSPLGKKLRTITVGEQPDNGSAFRGTTDVAFGPGNRIFVADGYGNARVIEYTALGTRMRQWGRPGSGASEFHLPHAIQIDREGILYVADRENGRIEKFNTNGTYLGEIGHLGRCYALKRAGDALWASMSPLDEVPGSPGWLVKLDPKSGNIIGHLDIPDQRQGHAIELLPSGDALVTAGDGLLWFRVQ